MGKMRKGGRNVPYLYLSPSTQEANSYINNGTEEYWMNLVADAMEPYLRAAGINVTRNTPDMTAYRSILQSNAGNYDFHLALHSNASPESLAGVLRGTDVYYYPGSMDGLRMANIIVDNLKTIYPDPSRVKALSTTSIGEVRRTQAPSVLVELAYHDNLDDALWIQGNLPAIGQALALSVTEYFGLPFLQPQAERSGTVSLSSGQLNLRDAPSTAAPVLAQMPNGAAVTVVNRYDDWYVVEYRGILGYARAAYIAIA
jgi:N-acetylmuramoyl-L-alanine amidase